MWPRPRLPDYNTVRAAYPLSPVSSFTQITSDPDLQATLAGMYENVCDLDPWIGALAEGRLPALMIGPLLRAVLSEQFTRLRDADRFWYLRVFSGDTLAAIEATRLSDVVRRNTATGAVLPADMFRGGQPVPKIPTLGIPGLLVLCVLMMLALACRGLRDWTTGGARKFRVVETRERLRMTTNGTRALNINRGGAQAKIKRGRYFDRAALYDLLAVNR